MKTENNFKSIITEIRKKYEEGTIHLGLDDTVKGIDIIPTASQSLNYITGIGGLPRGGRICEIYGGFSSAKTTLALQTIAIAQKMGLMAAFIDAENAMSLPYTKKLGVDLNKLIFVQTTSAEESLNISEDLIKTKELGIIVIDSVAALTPQAEIDGNVGQAHIGILSRLMGQALRKITNIPNNTAIVFINQTRANISPFAFAETMITPGGNALKYFASLRIDMRRSAKIKKGDDIIGNRINVKIEKNKLASPFKNTTFDVIYNHGIAKESDLINICLEKEILKKEGNSIFYGDLKLGSKMETSEKYLADNPEMYNKIADELKKTYLI